MVKSGHGWYGKVERMSPGEDMKLLEQLHETDEDVSKGPVPNQSLAERPFHRNKRKLKISQSTPSSA